MRKAFLPMIFSLLLFSCLSNYSTSSDFETYNPRKPGKADLQLDGYTLNTVTDPFISFSVENKIYVHSVYQMYDGSQLDRMVEMKKNIGLVLFSEIETNRLVKYVIDELNRQGYNAELYPKEEASEEGGVRYYFSVDYGLYQSELEDQIGGKIYHIEYPCLYYSLNYYDEKSRKWKEGWRGTLTKREFKDDIQELSDIILKHFMKEDASIEDVLPSWYY